MTKFQIELKRLRKEHNLTQEQLAEKLGLTRSRIGNYEQGNREPSFEILELLADFFNVSMGTFLDEGVSECDLYVKCYEQESYKIVQQFLKLDERDKGYVSGIIHELLKESKYHQDEIKTSKGDTSITA